MDWTVALGRSGDCFGDLFCSFPGDCEIVGVAEDMGTRPDCELGRPAMEHDQRRTSLPLIITRLAAPVTKGLGRRGVILSDH